MIRKILLFLLVYAAYGPVSYGAEPTQLLYDFREPIPAMKIAPEIQKPVLDKLFPKYLKSSQECSAALDANKTLEQQRKAGRIVPSVDATAEGSFTGPGLSQTAYLVSVRECYASHADNFGSAHLVIMTGDKVEADLESPEGSVLKTTDVNQDGINELLLSGGGYFQGFGTVTAKLVDFQAGQRRVLHDFGTVVSDSCDARNDHILAAVLRASSKGKGQRPEFTQENFQAACHKENEKPVFKPFSGTIE